MSVNEGRVCNRETSTKASSFYKLIASFEFIATLVLTRSILDLTLSVTELLQEKVIVNQFHNNCYRIIIEIANKVSITETKPRTAAFQKNRNNVPSVSDYFEKVVTIALLDHLLTQLNIRFDSAFVIVYGGLEIVPVKMLSLHHKNIDLRQKFRPFTEFYKSDLPCYQALEAELDLWEAFWLNDTGCHPDNIS